jgi:lysylphosphatidylglycerol synthetase-like protein (DUF2156 family)
MIAYCINVVMESSSSKLREANMASFADALARLRGQASSLGQAGSLAPPISSNNNNSNGVSMLTPSVVADTSSPASFAPITMSGSNDESNVCETLQRGARTVRTFVVSMAKRPIVVACAAALVTLLVLVVLRPSFVLQRSTIDRTKLPETIHLPALILVCVSVFMTVLVAPSFVEWLQKQWAQK